MNKHQKHTKLARRHKSKFGPPTWALLGTSCDRIQTIFQSLAEKIADYKFALVDADHHATIHDIQLAFLEKRIKTLKDSFDAYDTPFFLDRVDAVLVNGNHYPADRQIVFIDKRKENSLKKRIDQLTRIDVVLTEDEDSIYPFVKQIMTKQKNTLVLHTKDDAALADYISDQIRAHIPPLKVLILAGGKSVRMGQDKSQMNIHGKAQELYLAELCASMDLPVYISKRQKTKSLPYRVIEDRFIDLGPFGAICSAFREDPNAAWLVIACDLPNVTKKILHKLIDGRNPSKYATAFKLKSKNFPEPLITIYEPRSYSRLLQFLALGYSCPRKMLINSDIALLETTDEKAFFNLNTPEDLTALRTLQ